MLLFDMETLSISGRVESSLMVGTVGKAKARHVPFLPQDRIPLVVLSYHCRTNNARCIGTSSRLSWARRECPSRRQAFPASGD